MNLTLISNVVLMSFLFLTVFNLTILASDDKNINAMELFSFVKTAYAQNASTSDNSTDLGIPSDNTLGGLGLPQDNSTNSTTSGTTLTNTQNQTSSATTPEFGSLVPIVLVISIISIVIISRTKLGFN